MPSFVPATREHLLHIAAHMRGADRQEIWAAAHSTPLDALERGVGASRDASIVMLAHEEPVAVAGCACLGLDVGSPWMLGTDKLVDHKKAFLRKSRQVIEVFQEDYSTLVNYVDARNTLAVHWLRWLGFQINEPQPYGVEGLPFHFFWKRR